MGTTYNGGRGRGERERQSPIAREGVRPHLQRPHPTNVPHSTEISTYQQDPWTFPGKVYPFCCFVSWLSSFSSFRCEQRPPSCSTFLARVRNIASSATEW